MSADPHHACLAALLLLAAATASTGTAQAQAPAVARPHAVARKAAKLIPPRLAAPDAAAELRFEAITPLPDTVTFADLQSGVPILVQTVTGDGRPVSAALTWRILSGDATRISADRRTDREGYATAKVDQELGELPRPGRLVLEARIHPRGGDRDLVVRLSAVLVRK
jgi:hypothetical protein